jgi:sugar/nucleoside kinase (ribokinase family)
MSILVVGSIALDSVKTPFGEETEALGGSATYFSICARNFNPVNLVAVVGEDFPSKYVELFKEKNIDIEGLEIEKGGETFRWVGEYGQNLSDAKTIATHLNVLATFDPKVPEKYKESEYVFLANSDPKIQLQVLKQMKNPKLVVCDTMNYYIENSREDLLKILKEVDVFVLNDIESRLLTGEVNLIKAAKKISDMGPKTLVIKRGEYGAVLYTNGSFFCLPAFLLETVFDPTGAGDTFAGGFVGYLSTCGQINEDNLKKAIVYGNIMATFTVENFSVKSLSAAKKEDIENRYNEFKRLTQI